MNTVEGKRILIIGSDGYIGWPLSCYLESRGANVYRMDNLIKRQHERLLGVRPILPCNLEDRMVPYAQVSATNYDSLLNILNVWEIDVVVHLGEMPSAPLSQIDHSWAKWTQENNVLGTLALIWAAIGADKMPHIVKLGTMGEYGTPNIPIEEGWLDVKHKGYSDRLLFPKKPGSFYHCSKVHDSTNLEFACRVYGLRVTDLNQGVVWGTSTPQCPFDSPQRTSFHYDEIFGTVINRFAAQAAAGVPLTIYGSGLQKRGFIHLLDSLRCIEIACSNSPEEGEFRVFNQLTELLSIGQIAQTFHEATGAKYELIEDPRVEDQKHLYLVNFEGLRILGMRDPHLFTQGDAQNIVGRLCELVNMDEHREAIAAAPKVKWRK